MNPKWNNEDFQSSQIRKFAEVIYSSTEKQLVETIVNTLWLKKEKKDDIDPKLMEFEYAYKKLQEAWYNLNHKFIENWGKSSLEVSIYKLDKTYTYDVKTNYSISITN